MQNETIKLSLPINAAYVSAARLTASSISNRLTFDIDEIEDIKAAVSEACTYIIKHAPANGAGEDFVILFTIDNNKITILFSVPFIIKADSEEMSLLMIKALMDEFSINGSGDCSELRMAKKHIEISFD